MASTTTAPPPPAPAVTSEALVTKAGSSKPRKRAPRVVNQIPQSILDNEQLTAAIAKLPSNYNFEIRKTVWKVREANATVVALQFPEGLLLFACIIADIIESFTGAEALVMGDVTYGACCVDDFSARALGADFMVHYGHSCLVPIDVTSGLRMLYVFVDIKFDVQHLMDTVKANFEPHQRVAVLGTIQFAPGVHVAQTELAKYFDHSYVPQVKPLSPGEVLGCTSPKLTGVDSYIFVADGRFHLESVMIQNPTLTAYRYNPYSKRMTVERYDHDKMRDVRHGEVQRAAAVQRFGIILGTLGRQGNPAILNRLEAKLKAAGKQYFVLLLSEIFPKKLASFTEIDAWIQIACPRLSIDWGTEFAKPLLNPFEAEVALQAQAWPTQYPMGFYASGQGAWSNYYKTPEEIAAAAAKRDAARAARAARREARAAKKGGGSSRRSKAKGKGKQGEASITLTYDAAAPAPAPAAASSS